MTYLPEDVEALELAQSLGVHRIGIPTPFGGLVVNVYLIAGERPALVDVGPNRATSFAALELGLEAIGHSIRDIRLILLTHHHMDHAGLAAFVSERAGAEIVALDLTADYVADYESNAEKDDVLREQTMVEHGVAPDLAAALHASSITIHGFGASAVVARRVIAGEVVELGESRLRALYRPGHSTSDTVWVDDERRVAFAGDHLLRGVSSNAIVDRDLSRTGPATRAQSLVAYRESLLKSRAVDARLVLSGHGNPITDHRGLIDQRLRQQDARACVLFALLGTEPRTARELSLDLLGDAAKSQAFLALSETLGHLDLLVAEGRARQVALNDGRCGFVRVSRTNGD